MVVGHIRDRINVWKSITSDNIVLDWLSNGVKIDFSSVPTDFELQNRTFSKEEHSFVRSEIQSLLSKGCVKKLNSKPKCVSPLSVVPKKGPKKFRLIHDLRLINEKSIAPSLSYEDILTTTSLCEPNDFLTTLA